MKLDYARYYHELEWILGKTHDLVERAGTDEHRTLMEQVQEARARLERDAPLRIAVVGQFSAGKSALISALTGAEVAISADVTTRKTAEYTWQGLVLVDTPGVHSDSDDTAHDRIAREATHGADLVLFVVSNELFNPRLAEHLRFILDSDEGLGLASKTCLVINKVDRESDPDPDAELLSEAGRVLEPYPEVPVFFCAAGKLLQARKTRQAHLAERFESQSRIDELADGLNRFVAEAGTAGRLQTPLQQVSELLNRLESELAESKDQQEHLELIRRKRRVYEQLEQKLREVRNRRKQEARNAVMAQANGAMEQVTEGADQQILEELFEQGLRQASSDVDAVYDAADTEIKQALNEARADLEAIGDSPLGQAVARIHAQRAETAGVDAVGEAPSAYSRSLYWGRQATDPLQQHLGRLAQDPQKLRDLVYQIGKKMGKKFKPWEAVKTGQMLSRVLGRVSKAMPWLALAMDIYSEIREEQAKQAREQHLAEVRSALHKAFAEQADNLAEALESALDEISRGVIQPGLQELEAERREIVDADAQRRALQEEIGTLQRRCAELRHQL
ncbi:MULTISPECIES: GTPase [unclassified Halorhodospira]|uniref:GTPase n=1 Tax=unclassified Halorhodospira TaxID=2626748 RepID=UPI001EE7B674|nr:MULTISPECIES: GTPase [unclassified Halorhodospira]MCG5541923.1 50S ribosome-binding GTPase [Halorhodospira sp. M39old]MCG5547000.1 50S ribosome-binding GTPase [Halorhodospira sp. M38]